MTGNNFDTPSSSSPLLVRDYRWGCVYTGTRIQIIAAGIIPLRNWPTFAKGPPTFEGQWEIAGCIRKVTVEHDYCPTDSTPGEVWVHYREEELSPYEKVDQAIEKLKALHAEILDVVTAIKPLSLSTILNIPADRTPG